MWIVGISDNAEACVSQFLGISPMQTVGKGVADNGKVLMAIGANQRLRIRLAIKPEAILGLKLQTSDTYS